MQDAKVLNKKDILRFKKAVDRLSAIAASFLGNGAGNDFDVEPVKKRRRRKRKLAEATTEEAQD